MAVPVEQQRKFISEIAPVAQKAHKELGKVLPSVCIGMACCECAYGTAGSVRHHSYLGHKVGSGKTATKYWSGKFFSSKTSEEYQVGVHTIIRDNFRAFDSMEQCVYNFYELLNTSLYARVKADADYATQMEQIKLCGYMTSSTEVETVKRIIKTHNLTKYDLGNVTYFPQLQESIIMGLKAVDADSSYEYRKRIALVNGILDYKGRADQNMKMYNLLKDGLLIKPL